MSPRFESVDPQAVAFLQRDYELKVQFLNEHYGRMWTRFNFFLVAISGIAFGFFDLYKTGGVGAARPLLAAGALIAFCWYCFGAQDRYLAEVYRSEIRRAAGQLEIALGLKRELAKLDESSLREYVPVSAIDKAEVKLRLYQWRVNAFSTTKLAALFPFLLMMGFSTFLMLSYL